MSLSQLLNREVTIVRRTSSGALDGHGNEIPAETSVVTVGELQQKRRDEQDDQGEFSDTLWLLVLPAGTAIDTGDAVVVDGQQFEMVGDPWEARNPRTRQQEHIEATLRRTRGAEDAP